MSIFPNSSVGVSRFGFALFGMAALGSVVFLIAFPSDYVIQYFNSAIAVAGLVAISAGSQLKRLEERLDKLEGKRG